MWPWEHAVVGYLAYSLYCHAYYRNSPAGLETLVVVGASVLPDVIDKPLAWELGLFESGYALGHSILFAVPLAMTAGVATRLFARPRIGIAFGLGYLLHLPADVLFHYFRQGTLPVEIVLWPIASTRSGADYDGFWGEFVRSMGRYQETILAGDVSTYTWVHLSLLGTAFLVWLADGAPVLRELLGGGRRLLRRWADRAAK